MDIQKSWEKDKITHTWSNKHTSSRIDYIWLSAEIAPENIHSFENKKAKEIANSDHTLLESKLFSDKIFETQENNKQQKRLKERLIIIDSTNATERTMERLSRKSR